MNSEERQLLRAQRRYFIEAAWKFRRLGWRREIVKECLLKARQARQGLFRAAIPR